MMSLFRFLLAYSLVLNNSGPQQRPDIKNEELNTIFDCQRSGLPFPPKDTKDDTPVLLCLAGFPDSASIWNPLTDQKEFQSTHHVITLGLPGFQKGGLPDSCKYGYTLQQILDELHKVVLYCHRTHPSNQATVHLVGHDWGAQYCYCYVEDHPERVDKYAALDIGLMNRPATIQEQLRLVGYFVLFSLAFIVNNVLSKALASLLIECYPWDTIGPLDKVSTGPLFLDRPKQAPHLTYPYFQYLKDFATGNQRLVRFSKIKQVPQCFIYGTNKRVMYHSKRYLGQLETTTGCSWHAIQGGGHWFYTEIEHTPKVTKILSEFFAGQ